MPRLSIDFRQGDILALKDFEPYDFWLCIVYSIDNVAFENEAKELASKVEKKFPELIQKSKMGSVNLVKCETRSEEDFTLRDQRKHIELFLDYLSYDE
jgi:hypothetical protein